MPPEAAGRLAGQRTTVDAAGHRVPRGHRHRERPAAGPDRTEQTAGNDPALANGLPAVERNRSPHRHRSDNRESRSQQHRDQHIKRTGRGITNAATTKRVSCCAVPSEQRHEHSSWQSIHHESRIASKARSVRRQIAFLVAVQPAPRNYASLSVAAGASSLHMVRLDCPNAESSSSLLS